jgi:hypothetical protein
MRARLPASMFGSSLCVLCFRPRPTCHSLLVQDARETTQENPFFSDDVSSPPATLSDPRKLSSWINGTGPQQEMPLRGLKTPSYPHMEPVHFGHSIQTPRSQSQASTSSNSPHHTLPQLDMLGATMAMNAWHGPCQPHLKEHACTPWPGQGVYSPQDHRAPPYQVCHSVSMLFVCSRNNTETCRTDFAAAPADVHALPGYALRTHDSW